ncbi:SH3 domain-containing protein [Nocardioides zeae]|uniref:SH3 domain-containing protein n=1 Tax=Nocardioides zeae TaxID=1457234 RepID=A0A6P0HEU4_9ACTN|nr:SH3 domain-containing protein [Nocardioides zeae]NEN76874.1 SH3 domain-containing protein [Nocardioides zeae]
MAEPSHQRDDRLAPTTTPSDDPSDAPSHGTPAGPSGRRAVRAVSLPGRVRALAREARGVVRGAPRRVVVAGPLATLATVGVVAVGVGFTDADPAPASTASSLAEITDVATALDDREAATSRSVDRAALAAQEAAGSVQEQYDAWRASVDTIAAQRAEAQAAAEQRAAEEAATAEAVANADTTRWATTDLNLHTTASPSAEVVGLLEEGAEVLVTGRSANGREEVVHDGASRWVTAGYLDSEEPVAAAPGGSAAARASGGECTTSSTPSSVSANIAALHESVCAAFPQVTSYGGWRGDGDHGRGLALDIMVRGDLGWDIAEYIRANYTQWNVNYVIYEQKIWSVDRSSEGWRSMEDRGSDTANHYDHVHVSVY